MQKKKDVNLEGEKIERRKTKKKPRELCEQEETRKIHLGSDTGGRGRPWVNLGEEIQYSSARVSEKLKIASKEALDTSNFGNIFKEHFTVGKIKEQKKELFGTFRDFKMSGLGGDRRGWDGMLQAETSRSVAKDSKGVGVTETVIEGGRRLGLTEKHGAKIS